MKKHSIYGYGHVIYHIARGEIIRNRVTFELDAFYLLGSVDMSEHNLIYAVFRKNVIHFGIVFRLMTLHCQGMIVQHGDKLSFFILTVFSGFICAFKRKPEPEYFTSVYFLVMFAVIGTARNSPASCSAYDY